MSGNIDLGTAGRTFTVNPGLGSAVADLDITGSIAGNNLGLTKAGVGMMRLSGVSTYTGATTVTTGTLKAGSAQAFGPAGSSETVTCPAGQYHAGIRWPHQSWRLTFQSRISVSQCSQTFSKRSGRMTVSPFRVAARAASASGFVRTNLVVFRGRQAAETPPGVHGHAATAQATGTDGMAISYAATTTTTTLTVEPEVPDVPDVPPDLVLTGPPDGVGGLVAGFMSLAEAAGRGVTTDGDTALLDRLRPDLSAAVRS